MKETLWSLGLVVCVVLLQGCSGVQEVDALRFLELAKEIREVHSAKSMRLLCACRHFV